MEPDLKNSKYKTMSSIIKFITSLNKKKDRIVVLSPMNINYFLFNLFGTSDIYKKYKPKFVVYDEGIGSYSIIKMKTWQIISLKGRGFKNIFGLFKFYVNWIIKEFLELLFVEEKFFLFSYKGKQLKANNKVVSQYKEIIKKMFIDIPDETKKYFNKNFALFISQPFVEYNQISEKDYMSLIMKINNILQTKNIEMIIKPHPRENKQKFEKLFDSDKVIEKSILIESIFSLKSKIVIGFTSTALVTASIFYDIKSISLLHDLQKLSNNPTKIIINSFKHKFSNYVSILDDYNEIVKYI